MIGEVGKHLAAFLATYDELIAAPFLEDLARLEWATIETFYADDSNFANAAIFAGLSEDDLAEISFVTAPSAQILYSHWPLEWFWYPKEETTPMSGLAKTIAPNAYLHYRHLGVVELESLPPIKAKIFELIQRGCGPLAALEEASRHFPNEDIEASIMTWFNAWVSCGVISQCVLKKTG